MVYKPLHLWQNRNLSTTGGRNAPLAIMGIEIELIIAAADIVLALLLAVSLPVREETT